MEIKAYHKNPRKITDRQLSQLDATLKEFGDLSCIVISVNSGEVIAGNQRTKIFKLLDEVQLVATQVYETTTDTGTIEEGYFLYSGERFPYRKVNWTAEQEERANIIANKAGGDWDAELLKLFDTDLLIESGFEANELNDMWDDLMEVQEDKFDLEKALEEIIEPVTQPGDIITLGSHRLICGDSTDPEVLKRLLGNEIVKVVYCDPPYNIGLSYDKGIKGSSTKKTYTNKVFNDNKKPAQYLDWLVKSISSILNFSDNAHVFYWCDPKHIGIVQNAFSLSKVKNKSVCFWVKNQFNPVTQMAFNRIYEPCIYGTRGKPKINSNHTNYSEILNKEAESKAIREFMETTMDMWFHSRDISNDYLHPTQKPVGLHQKPLKRCSLPGDIVFDGFGGSGSTLMACEQMNRSTRLIELDPVFCDVIVNRWEKFTNQKAIRNA